ncbi:MAG: ATP-binding protein [Anaerolineaceae bacterium]|jgi:signal transduction histidine kinase
MPRSLYGKLAMAFGLVSFTTALVVTIVILATGGDRLLLLITDQQRNLMEETLVEYYQVNGSWDNINEDWWQIQRMMAPGSGRMNMHMQGMGWQRRLFGLADVNGVVLVAVDRYAAGSQLSNARLRSDTPIVVGGERVGTLLTARRNPALEPAEQLFLQRTTRAAALAALGAMGVALVMSFFLARTLTRPLRDLTGAAQKIARGQHAQQVDIRSQDEIGQLAAAFNSMSREVARENQLRRQMTADIAHDLRTPLTVVGGYLEAMRDGVLEATPDRLELIYSEIERLQKLVGDLRMLSQADAGELPLYPQMLDPAALLGRAAELFEHHAGQKDVLIRCEAPENLPPIQVDADRMMQVLDNLLINALRYTSPGGEIVLSAKVQDSAVQLVVRDTGAGIPAEKLPHIFNRFYRADSSRHAEMGESGLGLAIVRALVEAQGGRVWAESEPGQGTQVSIEFPKPAKYISPLNKN